MRLWMILMWKHWNGRRRDLSWGFRWTSSHFRQNILIRLINWYAANNSAPTASDSLSHFFFNRLSMYVIFLEVTGTWIYHPWRGPLDSSTTWIQRLRISTRILLSFLCLLQMIVIWRILLICRSTQIWLKGLSTSTDHLNMDPTSSRILIVVWEMMI